MWRLERVWEEHNRTAVLMASGAIILAVAFADWWTKPFVAFGVLYLFPIMLAAGFLPRWVIALLGVGCAVLSEVFSSQAATSVSSYRPQDSRYRYPKTLANLSGLRILPRHHRGFPRRNTNEKSMAQISHDLGKDVVVCRGIT